jgi:hypothetical protein
MKDKYLQVRIFKSGKIKVIKCQKDYVDYTGGDLYSVSGFTGKTKKTVAYDYFITTENRYKKDCKKHFDKMLKEIRKQYDVLDKKRHLIFKQLEQCKKTEQ